MPGVLNGRVAIVTGAGRGIGQAIAKKLAREGARVVVNDLDAVPAQETASEIAASGGEATAFAGSVTATDSAEKLVTAACTRYGSVDIIVNNAGYTWDNVIQKMTDDHPRTSCPQ